MSQSSGILGLAPDVLFRTLNPGSWDEYRHVNKLCLTLHLAQVQHSQGPFPGMFFQFLLVHIVRSSSCFDESAFFHPKQGQYLPFLMMQDLTLVISVEAVREVGTDPEEGQHLLRHASQMRTLHSL